MTRTEHIEIHKKLYDAFGTLIADFISMSPTGGTRLLSKTTLIEFIKWSYQQTIEPEEKK